MEISRRIEYVPETKLFIIAQKIEARKVAYDLEASKKRTKKTVSKAPTLSPESKAQFKLFRKFIKEGKIKVVDGTIVEVVAGSFKLIEGA